MRYLLVFLGLALASAPAVARPLNFSEIVAGMTAETVKSKLQGAVIKSMAGCKATEEIKTYSDGPSRCEYVSAAHYNLVGYDFEIYTSFYPSRGVKTLTLSWPHVEDDHKPSAREIENAYSAIQMLVVSKYGPDVQKGWWEYGGIGHHAEWQADGASVWHEGGERIVLKIEGAGDYASLSLQYEFADVASFNRF